LSLTLLVNCDSFDKHVYEFCDWEAVVKESDFFDKLFISLLNSLALVSVVYRYCAQQLHEHNIQIVQLTACRTCIYLSWLQNVRIYNIFVFLLNVTPWPLHNLRAYASLEFLSVSTKLTDIYKLLVKIVLFLLQYRTVSFSVRFNHSFISFQIALRIVLQFRAPCNTTMNDFNFRLDSLLEQVVDRNDLVCLAESSLLFREYEVVEVYIVILQLIIVLKLFIRRFFIV